MKNRIGLILKIEYLNVYSKLQLFFLEIDWFKRKVNKFCRHDLWFSDLKICSLNVSKICK